MSTNEDKLVRTINKTNDNLSLSGKPALVQNSLGIFYGILEKSDTRSGTALLRDGFMISPEKHITYLQYMDFIGKTLHDAVFNTTGGEHVAPMEVAIDKLTFLKYSRQLTITDYANEGIAEIYFRSGEYSNVS